MTEKDSRDEQENAAAHANGGLPAAPEPRSIGGPPGQPPPAPLAEHIAQLPEDAQEYQTRPQEPAASTAPAPVVRPAITLIEKPQANSADVGEAAPPPSLSIPAPHWPGDPILPGPALTEASRPEPEAPIGAVRPVETSVSAPTAPAAPARLELEPGRVEAFADPASRPASRASEPAVDAPSRPWAYVRKAARFALTAIVAYFALILLLIPLYRVVNPPASTLMLAQWLTLNPVDQAWVPLEQISPNLIRAVIVSEDDRFCTHNGIDLQAMAQAIEHGGRGASTISMQVTKNLFLWNSRSYIRKLIEIPLTLLTELVWPKWRILELYLNVAEWGPGVFGAEAAAQHHFNKPAARLSAAEAALLAASLPNPMVRDAGDPGPRTAAKGRVVQARMRAYGNVAGCVTDRYAPAAEAAPRDNVFRPARRPQAPASPQRRRERPSDSFFDSRSPL